MRRNSGATFGLTRATASTSRLKSASPRFSPEKPRYSVTQVPRGTHARNRRRLPRRYILQALECVIRRLDVLAGAGRRIFVERQETTPQRLFQARVPQLHGCQKRRTQSRRFLGTADTHADRTRLKLTVSSSLCGIRRVSALNEHTNQILRTKSA